MLLYIEQSAKIQLKGTFPKSCNLYVIEKVLLQTLQGTCICTGDKFGFAFLYCPIDFLCCTGSDHLQRSDGSKAARRG